METLKELRLKYPDIKSTSLKGFIEKIPVEHEKVKPSEGLGDTIEKIITKTGLKKVVEFIKGKDCGCDDRKAYLNETFRYKVECMVESEYIWWTDYLKRQNKDVIQKADVFEISRLFTRLFRKKAGICVNCPSGARRILEIIGHINKVYESY